MNPEYQQPAVKDTYIINTEKHKPSAAFLGASWAALIVGLAAYVCAEPVPAKTSPAATKSAIISLDMSFPYGSSTVTKAPSKGERPERALDSRQRSPS